LDAAMRAGRDKARPAGFQPKMFMVLGSFWLAIS
jgi:hypothetical protein